MASKVEIAQIVIGAKNLTDVTVNIRAVNPEKIKRQRTLELVIINGLQGPRGGGVKLIFHEEYYFSGRYFHQPDSSIPANDSTVAIVANQERAPTGVAGGMSFQIEGTHRFVVIGFEHPLLGSIKSHIEVNDSGKARDGYKALQDGNLKRTTAPGWSDSSPPDILLEACLKTSEIADRRLIFFITDMDESMAKSIIKKGK